jgi:hypothetical protein
MYVCMDGCQNLCFPQASLISGLCAGPYEWACVVFLLIVALCYFPLPRKAASLCYSQYSYRRSLHLPCTKWSGEGSICGGGQVRSLEEEVMHLRQFSMTLMKADPCRSHKLPPRPNLIHHPFPIPSHPSLPSRVVALASHVPDPAHSGSMESYVAAASGLTLCVARLVAGAGGPCDAAAASRAGDGGPPIPQRAAPGHTPTLIVTEQVLLVMGFMTRVQHERCSESSQVLGSGA